MARLLVMYNQPTDPDAFDVYFFSKHVPLLQRIPGAGAAVLSEGPIVGLDGSKPYHLIAEMEFESVADIQAGLQTVEGEAAAADFENFADGGFTVVMYETREAQG